jgi:hypothetical protein
MERCRDRASTTAYALMGSVGEAPPGPFATSHRPLVEADWDRVINWIVDMKSFLHTDCVRALQDYNISRIPTQSVQELGAFQHQNDPMTQAVVKNLQAGIAGWRVYIEMEFRRKWEDGPWWRLRPSTVEAAFPEEKDIFAPFTEINDL